MVCCINRRHCLLLFPPPHRIDKARIERTPLDPESQYIFGYVTIRLKDDDWSAWDLQMISAQKGRERDDEMSAAVCVCCVYLFCCKTHTHHPSRHLPQMRSDVLCHSRLYIIPSPGTGQNRLTFITLANPSFLFLFSFLVAHGFYFRSLFSFFPSSCVCTVYTFALVHPSGGPYYFR